MNLQRLSRSVKIFFNANTLLLLLLCFMIFGTTLLPESWYRTAYSVLVNLILICVIFCLDRSHRLFSSITVTVLIIFLNIAFFTRTQLMNGISDGLNFLFFIFAVYRLLKQVAESKMVTTKVIVQSISGYLLLGLIFSMAVARLDFLQPGAFSFPADENGSFQRNFYDQIYFSFITMGTVGYGDLLPKTPFAKSFSTLIGVSGQLYVAIVIAMLIGKFSSSGQSNQ
jgi:voltage-gated potassium channel